jgi:hypothetical protein
MKIKDRAKPKVPPVEPGVYMAVCIGFIDLGEQYSEKFKSYSSKGMYVWELPGETIEIEGEQKPRQLSKEFTISGSNKSHLRKFIESWNGKSYGDEEFMDFDLFDQVGKPCQLNVVLNETKEYANVDNLMPIPKGFPAPTTDTEQIRWDMDKWDDTVFEKLPEWIQDKIKKSTQYQKDHAPAETVEVKPQGEGAAPF